MLLPTSVSHCTPSPLSVSCPLFFKKKTHWVHFVFPVYSQKWVWALAHAQAYLGQHPQRKGALLPSSHQLLIPPQRGVQPCEASLAHAPLLVNSSSNNKKRENKGNFSPWSALCVGLAFWHRLSVSVFWPVMKIKITLYSYMVKSSPWGEKVHQTTF